MSTITLWNKGRRPWDLVDADGNARRVEPDEAITMEEAKGLRILKDYPRDWTEGERRQGRSAAELSRWEQSLKDREKNLDAREKALADLEKAPAQEPPKKRGRPASNSSEVAEGAE